MDAMSSNLRRFNVLKQSLILAALLVPSASFAADQTLTDSSDGSEKSICEAISEDQYRCAQAWAICHRDPVDGRCERSGSGGTYGCGAIFNPTACNNSPYGCVWDQSDPTGARCESLGD